MKALSKMERPKLIDKNTTVKRAMLMEHLTHPLNTHPNARLRFYELIMNAPACVAFSGLSVSLAKPWLNGSKRRLIHYQKGLR